jgi:hypothetical protein
MLRIQEDVSSVVSRKKDSNAKRTYQAEKVKKKKHNS